MSSNILKSYYQTFFFTKYTKKYFKRIRMRKYFVVFFLFKIKISFFLALDMRNYTWAIWYNWRLVAPYSDLNGWKVKKVLRKKRNSLQSSKSNIISFITKPFWGGEMILLSNCYKRCRVICILGKLFYLIHYELPVIHCFHLYLEL